MKKFKFLVHFFVFPITHYTTWCFQSVKLIQDLFLDLDLYPPFFVVFYKTFDDKYFIALIV